MDLWQIFKIVVIIYGHPVYQSFIISIALWEITQDNNGSVTFRVAVNQAIALTCFWRCQVIAVRLKFFLFSFLVFILVLKI